MQLIHCLFSQSLFTSHLFTAKIAPDFSPALAAIVAPVCTYFAIKLLMLDDRKIVGKFP